MRPGRPIVWLLTVCAVALGAQEPARPSRLYERAIETGGAGARKLPVDVPLLAGAQRFERVTSDGRRSRADGGLGDLRLIDEAGKEIAYLLLTPPRPLPSWIAASVLAIAQSDKASGFEIDLGGPREIDAVGVDGIPAPFLKRFRLEGSGDRARWTLLVAQGTLFDLPDERVRQTEVAFERGPYRYLRVTWDDTNSARVPLPRGVRARQVSTQVVTRPLQAAVSLQKQASEPGRSRYRVQLPSAGLPIVSLLLRVGSGDVFRTATVVETRFSGARADPVELGRARLVRMEPGSETGASLHIALQPPHGTELQLVVEDGSNPPLPLEDAAVQFAELPWIYFEAPDGPVVARYGDPAAIPPQYDLEARRAAVDLATVPEASWGEPRMVRPVEADAPAVSALPDRGAAVEVGAYSYRRPLPEATGLVALQLDAAVLAHSRGPESNFADLRIVDEQSRQIPYLVERRAEPLAIDLSVGRAEPEVRALREGKPGNRSIYALDLPHPNLPRPRLVLETPDRVFRRTLQIGVEREPDRRHRDTWFDVLATPTWQHADQAASAPPLEVAIAPQGATQVVIVVDEGDNRPLSIGAARLLLPSWRVRFFSPGQPLRLIYGKPDDSAPEYDLALLAPAVMGGEAQEIAALPEEASPSAPRGVLTPGAFWIGLGFAVLVLLALIVRLIASGASGASRTPPPPSPPAS